MQLTPRQAAVLQAIVDRQGRTLPIEDAAALRECVDLGYVDEGEGAFVLTLKDVDALRPFQVEVSTDEAFQQAYLLLPRLTKSSR